MELGELGRLLSPDEVAAMLGVRPETLNVWRARKQGPPYTKVNSVTVYPAAWLEKYLASRRVCPEEGCNDPLPTTEG
jgi:hypothetical protein